MAFPFILAYSICPSIACLCHVFINSRRAPSFPVGHFMVVSAASRKTSKTSGSTVTPEPKSIGRSAFFMLD